MLFLTGYLLIVAHVPITRQSYHKTFNDRGRQIKNIWIVRPFFDEAHKPLNCMEHKKMRLEKNLFNKILAILVKIEVIKFLRFF